MKQKDGVFSKYFRRLVIEGVIKSSIIGAIVGFLIVLAPSIIAIVNDYNVLLLAVICFLVCGAVIAVMTYRLFFVPNTIMIAKRLDRLGLEERLVTMLELESDPSYIAMIQREDAKAKLDTFDQNKFRISVFKLPLIILIFLAVASSTTIGLSVALVDGKMDYLSQEQTRPIGEKENVYQYYEIVYTTTGGGTIKGDALQVVQHGNDSKTIHAVAKEGWKFSQWFDGSKNPERTELAVIEDLFLVAHFEPDDDGGEEEDTSSETRPGPGGDVSKEDTGLIIDGTIYYRDELDRAYQEAMAILAAGGELPEVLRLVVEKYFEIIK